jgi:signal transduction histidine kinase
VRARFVGLSVLAAVLTIALFGGPLAAIVARYLIGDERGELERVADQAAIEAAVDLARGHPSTFPTNGAVELALYDPAGSRLAGQGPSVADSLTRAAHDGPRGTNDYHGHIVVAVPIISQGSILGVVRASTPRAGTYHQIAAAWLIMAGLATAALLSVWLAAYWMATRLNRPMEELAATARALGDGDFSARCSSARIREIDIVGSALNTTATRIDDLLSRERAFSADASHQLRTPLTALQLGLEVAREDPLQDPRDAIDSAIAQADRLHQTIEDLLALARDSNDRRQYMYLGSLHLESVLNEMDHSWRPPLIAQHRSLRIQPSAESPGSAASRAAVRQILSVLLANAYTHGLGAVTVSTRQAGSALAIDVADEGPGITDSPATVFARRSGNVTGHGIGLALARRLAEAEGGRLNLTRATPPIFTLLLPAVEAPTGSDNSHSPKTTPRPTLDQRPPGDHKDAPMITDDVMKLNCQVEDPGYDLRSSVRMT